MMTTRVVADIAGMENSNSDPKTDRRPEEFDLLALANVHMQEQIEEQLQERERCGRSFTELLTEEDTVYAKAMCILID